MNKKVTMPSGAVLEIQVAPFLDAKKLYKAIAHELKTVSVNADMELDLEMIKNLLCVVVESDRIEEAFNICAQRCLYNNCKISNDTFESLEARGDYLIVMREIIEANVAPFMKGLFAQSKSLLSMIPKV